MKKCVFILLAIIAGITAEAKKVKFSLDMGTDTVATTGMHIMGDFQTAAGYAADYDPSATPMINEPGTTIYSVVVDIPAFHKYEYKFINGDLSYFAEFVPLESRVGYDGNDNRWIYIDSTSSDTMNIGAIRYAGNAPAGKKLLRYEVNMQNAGGVSANGVHVQTNYEGLKRMYSFDGAVYQYIGYSDSGATHTYLYANGNTSGQYEEIVGTCTQDGNRYLTVNTDVVLDSVCYASCSACMVTGVATVAQQAVGIKLFPNPASTSATLQFNDGKTAHSIAIKDITGRVVFAADNYTGNSLLVNTTGFAPGLYLVNISGNTASLKLSVQ